MRMSENKRIKERKFASVMHVFLFACVHARVWGGGGGERGNEGGKVRETGLSGRGGMLSNIWIVCTEHA